MKEFIKLCCIASTLALTACGGSSSSDSSNITFAQTNIELTGNEDTLLTTNLSVNNASGSVLFGLANGAENGSVDIDSASGAINYQPDTDFFGEDSFQVSASDSSGTITTNVLVNVAAVNDSPVIAIDSILVTGAETKLGQITANDVDSDSLTYSVAVAPVNGSITMDATTGELSYIANELSLIDDVFTVLVSDGQAEVTAEISLKANTASNTDRAYYYFASDESHLKRAEVLLASIDSDNNTSLINQELAIGYAQAGLTSQVTGLLTEESILLDNIRAETMVSVALIYDQLDLNEEAEVLRDNAHNIYNQYIASIGLSAFSTTDIAFYERLARSYQLAGNNDDANQTTLILDLLFTQDSYSTALASALFSFSDIVDQSIEQWQSSSSSDDFSAALNLTERFLQYTQQMPPQVVTNDFTGNEGEFFYSVTVTGYLSVINYYIELGELELARSAMADALALYGVVNYDENFPREADLYAEVTKVEYEFGVFDLTASFVNLYPDASLDPLYAALPESSFWHFIIPGEAEDAYLMAQVRNLDDKSEALALILAERDDTDLRSLVTNLVAFNQRVPGGARILRQLGEFESAIPYLEEALNVITSEEYLNQNSFVIFTLGSSGCGLIINEALAIHEVSGLDSALTLAQSAVNACTDIALTHFNEVDLDNFIFDTDVISANRAMLVYANNVDLTEKKSALLSNIDSMLITLSDDADTLMTQNKLVAYDLATGGELNSALTYYQAAIEALNTLEANAISEEVGVETLDFFDESNSDADYVNFLNLLNSTAGLDSEYTEVLAAAKASWNGVIDTRLSELENASLIQQNTYLPAYASQLLVLNNYDKALAISADDALGEVESQAIVTQVAIALAGQDLFSGSNIASVDSDLDGLPNFFLATATEDDINASGLTLDDDSDNDGVIDANDSFPLDVEQQ